MRLSVFAIDLGATWLRTALVSPEALQISHRARIPTPGTASACRAILDAEWSSAGSPPLVALAAAPEVRTDGRVRRWPNLPGWAGDTILSRALLSRAEISIFDDATAAALSAHPSGAGAGTTVCLTIGTGIGGGTISGGRPLVGRRGAAMDVGHMPVPTADGVPCACGRTGCLQAVASGRAVARLLGQEGLVPAGLFGRDDPRTLAVLRRAVQAIAEGLAVLDSVFHADRHVLGGGFGLSPLFDLIAAHPLCRERGMSLARHPFGEDAGLIGSALGACRQLDEEPPKEEYYY